MTLDDFEKCILQLLNLARQRGIERLDTQAHDYYWIVPAPDWVDFTNDPKPAVGSLHDDLAELRKLLDDPDRGSSIDLDRAASLLHLLSDHLSG
ncbi:hypothetical protein MYSTI_07238 [Myxococcus stipitatus DSM 14675]|uniref:Uncharacterized protein n=1 Tax=Myxococcus stipitatus (strain DSM 14675 / JCM 12634 / Mx s8) TaxID=1278073 RepID=L7UKU2_MYXSD|nr:hypothetical protein [Myxococcus stipitatus]AGC48510.1 hypothetical protein MYSTI_07238 [Myxococcus stipitatus DSM 14675]